MGKTKELDTVIKELYSIADAIKEAADNLHDMFTGSGGLETEPALTLEQVRAVLADKARQGHNAEIRTLLQKYGAAKLSEIDPAHYKALLTDAEVLKDAN